MHELPTDVGPRRPHQVGGVRELTTPGPRAVLEAIAEIEPLDETLERFPGLDLPALRQLLIDVASRLPKERAVLKRTTVGSAMGDELHVWSDGASRGNPGPASIGAILRTPEGVDVDTVSERLGHRTNNYAEYEAVRAALERAISLGAKRVRLHADSQLVVRQLNGQYRVKNEALRPLYEAVKELERQLVKVEYVHVRRELNRDADALANEALDS